MSVRNLDAVFRPNSVALIGASRQAHKIGAVIAENMRAAGFEGPILPVNPKYPAVAGMLAYADVASLPLAPELAIICTPAQSVPALIAELGARGTRAAIVISAGFGEGGTAGGQALRTAMLAAAKPHLMRIVGPNCLGVLSSPSKLNASFAQAMPQAGRVAFVAQSGAMVTTVLDWANARGIGFSHLVSLGDMGDVDFGDMLDYLATDDATDSILLYIESVTQARKFMSAARAAARLKPVIAIKAGRQPAAAKAAASHTGALAGIDAVYDAAFARAGILRVNDLDEVFDAVETLAFRPRVDGPRLTILTNGGGVGVLATDSLIAQGGTLATLSATTVDALNAVLPSGWSHGNPVDIIGDADAKRYTDALRILEATAEQDAILVLDCPTALGDGSLAAAAVASIAKTSETPILTNWLGARSAERARTLFGAAGLPSYDTPEKAVRGFMHMVRYRRGQDTLMQVPLAMPPQDAPDRDAAKRILDGAPDGWLDGLSAQTLLECYRVPFPVTRRVATPDAAGAAAAAIGKAIALKVLSPDITHKSDAGGVVLNLSGGAAVADAAGEMLRRIAKSHPNARIDGFLVQELIDETDGYELIAGMAVDRTFGPFLLFGQGGTAVEVIDDKAIGLPPLNLNLAHEMMARTRIIRQLRGYRDRPPAAIDAIAQVLVRLSQLVGDFPQIAELDINPLLARHDGVVALDARVRIAAANAASPDRMAIRPYPDALARDVSIPEAGTFRLRPVRPEDAPAFERFFARLSPEDVHMRFFTPMRTLTGPLLARLTQIDYDREMAFVLFDTTGEIAGIGRLAADPDNLRAEFALLVRSDLKHHRLGTALMDNLVAYARSRGISEMWGNVLIENAVMLAFCRERGCRIECSPHDPTMARATLALSQDDSGA